MDEQYRRAKEYVFRILSYRPRTKNEIRDKLKEKKYCPRVIERVINILEEYNCINDKEFAALWIKSRCNSKPFGRWRLKQELVSKGIDRNIIEEQIEELVPVEKEDEMAESLILRKRKAGIANKEKIYSFLRRRGFSSTTISRLLSKYDWEEAGNARE